MRLCVTLFYSQCRMMYVVTCSSLLCAFFLVVVVMQVDLSFICSLLLCLRPWDSALVCISVWNLCLPCAWIQLPSEGCFFPIKVWGFFLPWKRSCDHPPSGLLWSSSLFKSCSVLKCWSDHWCSHSLSLGLFCLFLVKFNEVVLLFIVVVCCLYDCVQITVICIGSVKSLNCMDTVERSSLLRWSRGHL